MSNNENASESENQYISVFPDAAEETFYKLLTQLDNRFQAVTRNNFEQMLKYSVLGGLGQNYEESKAATLRIFSGSDIDRIKLLDTKSKSKLFKISTASIPLFFLTSSDACLTIFKVVSLSISNLRIPNSDKSLLLPSASENAVTTLFSFGIIFVGM